ncbi:unnamed protein product [Phytophthora fragariaefolia]|uniref:Unnamed protein product n=1 Tax=Phytophthora fragariaefolia TaxID=1490495 RepID=A0A9W6XP15_9STRA|nr:unnamed protein product [Phytophthora fragariaefolia]
MQPYPRDATLHTANPYDMAGEIHSHSLSDSGSTRSLVERKVASSPFRSGALPPLLHQMSDGQLPTSARAERPSITLSKFLPVRLQTSDQISTFAPVGADDESPRAPRSNSGLSRVNSFTPGSRKPESSADLPGVPSLADAPEEGGKGTSVFFQTCQEDEENLDHFVPLVRRSSQQNPSGAGDVFRVSRVHPTFSNLVVNSRKGSTEIEDALVSTISEEPCRDISHALITKRLSMHKLHIASRSESVVPLPVGAPHQPPDPSAHRMIYFRTKNELNELFLLPPVSRWGRRFNRAVFVLIMLGTVDLAVETCDGPNWGSTDPGYPYLLTEKQHTIYYGFLTALFTLEFLIRAYQARSFRTIARDPYMWLDMIGISPWYIMQILRTAGNAVDPNNFINMLRLIRLVRLGLILRHYEQSKVMQLAIKASLRPLSIIMFFLFTLVMILATAIFYAEPCYNVETCTFTDIFNSAVATVGYGHQVPSLKNPASLFWTMLAMILGQIYFSMPVAIIGNNFQRTYENFQMDKKKKARYLDASLSPFDCQNLHSHAKRLCDIQYHLLHSWSIVHNHIRGIARSNTKGSQSFTVDMLEIEADRQAKISEGIDRLLNIHTEAAMILQVFIPHRRRSLHISHSHTQGVLSNMYKKAKKAMAKATVNTGHSSTVVDPRIASQTVRGRLWLLLEVPDSSRLATIVNKGMVGFALVSIMLFFTESLQELAASGVETNGCRSVVRSYCKATGFEGMDAACFLRFENGTSDFTEQLDFSCDDISESLACYGNGLNFGSLNSSALTCDKAFSNAGVDYVCYRQQCRASVNMIFDMGPYWIYFEWLFGIIFTIELALRFYIAQDRTQFWKNFYVFFDVVAIVPFLVEVSQMLFADIRPDYAIVSTSPSFLSVIRVLKIMRILKLTRLQAASIKQLSRKYSPSWYEGPTPHLPQLSTKLIFFFYIIAAQDTLLQFSQVIEKLHEAPVDFEAFDELEDELHANIYPNGISPRPTTDGEIDSFPVME